MSKVYNFKEMREKWLQKERQLLLGRERCDHAEEQFNVVKDVWHDFNKHTILQVDDHLTVQYVGTRETGLATVCGDSDGVPTGIYLQKTGENYVFSEVFSQFKNIQKYAPISVHPAHGISFGVVRMKKETGSVYFTITAYLRGNICEW